MRETPLLILTMCDTLSFASLQISAGALILAQQSRMPYTRDVLQPWVRHFLTLFV